MFYIYLEYFNVQNQNCNISLLSSYKTSKNDKIIQTNLLKGGPVEAEVTTSSSILALKPQLAARSSWWGKRAMPGWARWASCCGRGKATLPWRKGPAASPHWPSLAACCCCWLRASRAREPWRSERATMWLLSQSLVLSSWLGALRFCYTAACKDPPFIDTTLENKISCHNQKCKGLQVVHYSLSLFFFPKRK